MLDKMLSDSGRKAAGVIAMKTRPETNLTFCQVGFRLPH